MIMKKIKIQTNFYVSQTKALFFIKFFYYQDLKNVKIKIILKEDKEYLII